jgi:Type II secretion system (T2SS), protein E, N-terminal domain/HEAT repeats
MPSLSSSIVNQQVASVRDVEEALSRQSLYGGDLITNLLELAAVSEERLSLVKAESHGLEPAPIGELPVATEQVRRLVPGDLAQRFALYPLEEREGSLIIAVAEPLPSETENDLSFSLGATLVQKVALLVRVRQAIARDYGIPLDRRSLRVLAKLSGRPDPSPSSLPSRPNPATLSRRPQTVRPDESAATTSLAQPAPRPESAEPRVPRAPAMPDFSSLTKPEPRSRPRRLGPYTAAMAERGLLEAETRDDVLRAFFDFAGQYFEYAALFVVHGDIAEGRDASGSGAVRSRVVAVGVPLDLPSAMSRARDAASYQLTRLGSGGLDGALAKDLERRPGRTVLFLPVQVRGRTVLILYGDHGDRDVELSAIGEVISFIPLVANAFERLIVKKRLREKGSDASPQSLRFGRVREPTPPLPNAVERAATLASVIEDKRGAGTVRQSLMPRSEVLPPAPSPSPPVVAAAPAPPIASPPTPPTPPVVISPPAPRVSAAPSRPSAFSSPPAPPPSAPRQPTPAPSSWARPVISIGPASAPRPIAPMMPDRKRRSEPPEDGWDVQPSRAPFPKVERGTKPGVGSGKEAPANSSSTPSDEPPPPSSQRTGALPRLQLVPEAAPPPAVMEGPEIDVSDEASETFEDELAPPSSEDGVPLAPASRSLAYSARPLPPREASQELRLPSVIVDLANDCKELVERLVHGDASASDKLVQIGDPAITQLVSIFPGPITSELRRGGSEGPSKASDCGPVLRTLARMGARPVPFVAVRTADGDPMVRAWATRLLGEMPSPESAQAVARRLTDEDAEVRRAALAAGNLLLMQVEAAEALQAKIAEGVSDVTRPEESRHSLIEALAELRAPLVVPTLVRLLEDGSPDIVRSAHWALGVIARQDFGTKAALWEEWWLAHSSRHRIEWLIDSLLHENQELRRTAGDELKSLTKEYFGYYDDLPKKERERAQERYRQWWETKGKARFR